jgi:hypothetical protein
MRLYIYYNKFDSSQEPYGVIETTSLTEAINQAATIKQMDINTFLKIFNVKPKIDGKYKV